MMILIKINRVVVCILLLLLGVCVRAFDIVGSSPTVLCVDVEENITIHAACEMFGEDFFAVSGKELKKANLAAVPSASGNIIVTGSCENPGFLKWLSKYHISYNGVKGNWETFRIAVVRVEGQRILVVMGSDKRGTAYGILELSRMIGVSPWHWWADVIPEHKEVVAVPNDFFCVQRPSVQYRGIFINDEENFAKWSSKVFETELPEKKTVGPKTYEKVFRLLLRLRANTIWPAMHKCSSPFFTVQGNQEMAFRYGITMATSHCEMMMRSLEWDEKKMGPYNYVTNHEKILKYWADRVKETSNGDNIYTLGMRGVHDLPLQGANSMEGKIRIVEQAIGEQRQLLKRYVNADVTKVPQVFVPYKEVLDLYNNGLQVPDDITLMWCNDNYGYLTRLSNQEEQKRKGGSGIYYHISYYGRPNAYTTLCTQSPGIILDQMKRAYDTDARKIWILNVGDIKPGEFDTELFLQLAWDINSVSGITLPSYMEKWYTGIFGLSLGKPLTQVMMEYYRLSTIRKPEHMGWNRIEETGYPKGRMPVSDCEFNPFENDDEVYRRMKLFDTLEKRVNDLSEQVSACRKNAYQELIQIPVTMACGMNGKWLAAKMNHLYARYQLPAAIEYASLADTYTRKAQKACSDYGTLVDGKWKYMLALSNWCKENDFPRTDIVDVDVKNPKVKFWCEHDTMPMNAGNEVEMIGRKTFIKIFSMNGSKIECSIIKQPIWIKTSFSVTPAASEARLDIIGREDAVGKTGIVVIKVNEIKYKIKIRVSSIDCYPVDINQTQGGENLPYVNMLGYSGKAKPLSVGKSYSFTVNTEKKGEALLRVGLLPLQPVWGGDLRYEVSIDDQQPEIVSIKTDAIGRDENWKDNVLRNQSITVTTWVLHHSGEHRITIRALDEGIVLDQMVLDFRKSRQMYDFPYQLLINQ